MPAPDAPFDAVAARVLKPGALAGLTGLVTGAGSGIGRGIACRLAELGMSVFGTGRRAQTLAETAELCAGMPGHFAFETCDLRDAAAASRLVNRVGEARGLDLLVNNAGGQFFAPATGISKRGWDAVLDLNLTAVFVVTQAAYPFLRARRGTVATISLSGVERGSMGMAHSIAARAGVLGLMRTLALEWAGDGIRLNCIGPGTVATAALAEESARPMIERLRAAAPLGRTTTVAEVAELVAFLASPAAAMITGQLLQIDGGAHIGPGLHPVPVP